MALSRHQIWLSRYLLRLKLKQSSASSGFTLLEVIISLVIASIIVSGLLYLVVELLQIDRREIALETVQRDAQRGLDYISDDLKEAVYVYSNPATIAAQLSDLQPDLTAGGVPVLAFWRPDAIEATLPANCSSEGTNSVTCTLLKTRRATYTLVVYYQQPQYGSWSGKSVIKRYELKQYEDLARTGATRYTQRAGYRDPIGATGTLFETWTRDGTATAGSRSVLIDYVDALIPTTTVADQVNCPTLINSVNTPLTGQTITANDYIRVPSTAANTTSFYACVRNPNPSQLSETGTLAQAQGTTFRSGQDVYIFLRGDATTVANSLNPASQNSRLPVLQSQVLVRGVINKDAID
jgi:prepilin-type N-terminal cleavage/methylation domain-containing protein